MNDGRPEFPSNRIVDRIGPAGTAIGNWIPDRQFGYAGLRHDIDYFIGGNELNRINKDLDFYGRMLEVSTDRGDSATALIYYNFVSMFGSRYYNYKAE